MAIKISRQDKHFAKLCAEGRESVGACYAKSRRRPYKGLPDDINGKKLLEKNEDVRLEVNAATEQIVKRDIAGRQEILIGLTETWRALQSQSMKKAVIQLGRIDYELATGVITQEQYDEKYAAIDMRGIKKSDRTKRGWKIEAVDIIALSREIIRVAGYDLSKPIDQIGDFNIRETLGEMFLDIDQSEFNDYDD
ncbi:hypothetical protein [Kosakonia sacchari]|uniref:hypothetical protein n=1 Tax=Kosakonia sacchari TaxID=1158459 RepID=UPI0015858FE5|nr:hypothetical protein [Kosakonia sacchari]NUL35057.1 hypothetical protein [Kosakonia sacchari]